MTEARWEFTDYSVERLPDAHVRLTLELCDLEGLGSLIISSELRICPSKRLPVEVIEVLPRDPLSGNILTLIGHGFGEDPNKIGLELHAPNGARSMPLEILSATDTRITARLWGFPPDLASGWLWIGIGSGNDFALPAFDPGGPYGSSGMPALVEGWRSSPDPGTDARTGLKLNLLPSVPGVRWFYSGPPTANGELCLLLDGGVDHNAVVTIAAASHPVTAGSPAGHLLVRPAPLVGDPDPLVWAGRLADLIREAFWQQALVRIEARVEPGLNNGVQLILSLPHDRIAQGHLAVSLLALRPPAPTITGFTPTHAGKGDLITIQGSGFGEYPAAMHLALRDDTSSRLTPLRVLAATSTQIVARLGHVPPDVQRGTFYLQHGMVFHGRSTVAGSEWDLLPSEPYDPSSELIEPASSHAEPIRIDLIPDRVRCFYGSADPLDPYGSIVLALEGYESPFCRNNLVMTVQLDLMDLDGSRLLPSGSLSITLPDDATLNECANLLVDALTSGVESLTGEELLVEVYAEDAYHVKVVARPHWIAEPSRLLGGITVCLIEPEFVPAFETIEMAGHTVSLTVETHVGFTYTLQYREGFSRGTPWRPVLTLAGDDAVHTLTYSPPAGRGFFRLDVE